MNNHKFSQSIGRRWRWIGGIGLIGGLLSPALAAPLWAKSDAVEPPRAGPTPRKVRVAPVEAAAELRGQRYPGVVRAENRAVLAFQLPGRLAQRLVNVGDRVTRGQTLARLDARALRNAQASSRAQLDETEARLRQQKRDRDRTKQLYREGVVAATEHEAASAQLEVLEASRRAMNVQVRDASRLVGETRLEAPFAGVVVAVHTERGELVSAGSPVIELSGDERLEVEVFVPEHSSARLRVGQSVSVSLPLLEQSGLSGRIQRIGSAAGGGGRMFPVVVSLTGALPEALRPGVSAEVTLDVVRKPAVSVPVAAVRDPSGTAPTVFVLTGDRVRTVSVSVQEILGERVIVDGEGLTLDDRVVVAGLAFLLDGDAVVVAEGET